MASDPEETTMIVIGNLDSIQQKRKGSVYFKLQLNDLSRAIVFFSGVSVLRESCSWLEGTQ
jgi:hypothetical protein